MYGAALSLVLTLAFSPPILADDDPSALSERPPEVSQWLLDLRDDNIPGNAGTAERELSKRGLAVWPYVTQTLESTLDPQQRRFSARIAMTIATERKLDEELPAALLDASVRALHFVKWIRGKGRDENIDGLVAFYRRYWDACAPRLVAALDDPDDRIRTWAAIVLVGRSPSRYEFPLLAVKRLFEGLVGSVHFHVADECVRALHSRAIPQARQLVRSRFGGDHAVYIASQILADIDDPLPLDGEAAAPVPASAEPIRALIEVAIDGLADDEIQWNNKENRARLLRYGVAALPFLEAAFTSQDRLQEQSCIAVAQEIVRSNPNLLSRELLVASVDAMRDDHVKHNAWASRQFLSRFKDDARALLLSGLASPDPQQRFLSAYVLSDAAEARDATPTIDSLVEFLDDNEFEHDAQWACHMIYRFQKVAIPDVERHYRTSRGQRRRALGVVLQNLRSEDPPSRWDWDEKKFNDHGLSHYRADPCVRTPPSWPEFRRRERSPVQDFLNGRQRIPALMDLVRDVGRGGVDWKLGGIDKFQPMFSFGRRTSGDTIWLLRVRYGPNKHRKPTFEWQPYDSSPKEDPWFAIRP